MNTAFNERLSELICRRGFTQKELAAKAGVTEAAVSHYLKGDRVPRASVMARMADALDTTTDYLYGGTIQNADGDIAYARRLIARNVHQMTHQEKMDIINILMSDN